MVPCPRASHVEQVALGVIHFLHAVLAAPGGRRRRLRSMHVGLIVARDDDMPGACLLVTKASAEGTNVGARRREQRRTHGAHLGHDRVLPRTIRFIIHDRPPSVHPAYTESGPGSRAHDRHLPRVDEARRSRCGPRSRSEESRHRGTPRRRCAPHQRLPAA